MYKCIQCSKCFKDPDVFVLHQRTHTRSVDDGNTPNQHTLLANPILANLLEKPESSRVNSGVFNTNNVNSIENQIMMALAANMENYLQNLDSIMTPLSFMEKGDSDIPEKSDSQETDDRSMDCQNVDDAGIDNESHMEDNRSIESDDTNLVIVEENDDSQITNDSDSENTIYTRKRVYRKYSNNADFQDANDRGHQQKLQVTDNRKFKNENCDEKENRSIANVMSNYQENTLIDN